VGGFGSGKTSMQGRKGLTDHHFSIDIRTWQQRGLISDGRQFELRWRESRECLVSLSVAVSSFAISLAMCRTADPNEPAISHQTIWLDSTPCNFGGYRPWFRCPSGICGNRAAILYYSGSFACRDCCNLAYSSQSETSTLRASYKINRTRQKLGWKPGFLNGVEWKPKGMHWKTFSRLLRQHEDEAMNLKIQLAAGLGIDVSRLIGK